MKGYEGVEHPFFLQPHSKNEDAINHLSKEYTDADTRISLYSYVDKLFKSTNAKLKALHTHTPKTGNVKKIVIQMQFYLIMDCLLHSICRRYISRCTHNKL